MSEDFIIFLLPTKVDCRLLTLHTIHRLSNILQLANLDLDKIWNVVKDVKLESSETNLQCGFSSKGLSGFYEDSDIASQVKMVENKLSIESSILKFWSVTP